MSRTTTQSTVTSAGPDAWPKVRTRADVRSVTVYTKPGSIATPDYSWRETDLWIDFPWSWQGTVTLDGSVGAEGA